MTLAEQKQQSKNTDIDLLQLSDYFVQAFPVMNKLEQQTALVIYRSLSLAKPVTIEFIAKAIDQKKKLIDKIIHSWPGVLYDDTNSLIGFWGITIKEMPHQMLVNQHIVYTWCAWDALFIPELINVTARINSECPVTKQKIELQVSPTQVKIIKKKDVVVSMLKPDLDDFNIDVISSFCHFVFFFVDRKAGELWCAEHPNTFLLSLDDAFAVGKQMNAARYNLT